MRKVLLLVFTILLTNSLIAQNQDEKLKDDQPSVFKSLQQDDLQPVFVVVIDAVEYRIKQFRKSDFDHNWIRSIDVLKDEASAKRYNSKYGVVKIYVKKEFGKDALRSIEKNRPE